MATVVAGFLSPWPLGWISATPRPLGVDRGHPPWPDLCIFFSFFFFLVRWFTGERETWPLRVAGSLPLAVGVDRGHPQWPDLSFFFLFAGNVAGGGQLVAALLAGGGRWIFLVA
jgi:hypothetical protein